MIKIGIKGLAKFMTANSSKQRKILRDYKYPAPEGKAQAGYYREARNLIVSFHRNRHDVQWLRERANTLHSSERQSSGPIKSRLGNNARALSRYANGFGEREFTILPEINLNLRYANVLISINPDLHVREGRQEKIIKLEFSKEIPDGKMIKIINQSIFEAQSLQGMNLNSSLVLFFDVHRGREYGGARVSSRIQREIEAACQNISDLWGGI